MKRIVSMLVCCLIFAGVQAQKITRDYNNVSLSEALRQLNEQTHEYTISFLYNELEDFRIPTSVHRKTVPDAIRQMIGFYPIRMTVEPGIANPSQQEIIVECPQKTALRYKGTVIDEQGQPVAYANIALLSPQDSTLITGGVSNESGFFVIPCEQKPVLARVSFVGYKTIYKQCNSTELGTIRVSPDTYILKNVTVKGKQNALSVKDGAFMLNVSKTFLKDQPDIFSVLAFLPFVEASEGKVSVFGVGSTLYLINGREVRSMAEIEALQPDMLKNISLDLHPSAQYASKYGAVISITTVTQLKDFVNAQLNHKSTIGRNYSDTEGANINLAHGSWSHFLSYQYKDLRKKDWAVNTYSIKDESLPNDNVSENHSNEHNRQHELLYSVGLSLDEHNNIGLQYMLETSLDHDHARTIEQTIMGQSVTDRTTAQDNSGDNQLHSVDLLYKHNSGLGSLSVDGSYTFSTDRRKYSVMTNANDINNINGDNRYYVYTGQADYSRQIFSAIRLQAGAKYAYTHNVGLSDSYNPITKVSHFHNNTHLNDELAAGYLTLSKTYGKFYMMAGLRGEYYHSDYRHDNQEIYGDQTFRLYPSLQMNYTASPSFILSVGYNNKSQRPTFTELSPIIRYINAMLYEQGNPGLRMTSIHDLYASCVIGQRLVIQFNYRHDQDFVMYAFRSNPQVAGNIINSPVNVDARYFILNASYSDKLGIYRFSYNANIHYDATTIPVMGVCENHFKPRFLLSTVNQFDIAPQTMVFCDLGIASSYWSLGNNIHPQYKLRIGIYKTFFADKRLTAILSVNDLLRRSNPDSQTKYGNVWSNQQLHLDTRNVTLTVKYNINKFKNVFKKNTNNEEEIMRIK